MKREERFEKYWEKPSDPGTVLSIATCERWMKRVSNEMNIRLTRLYNEPLKPAETRYLNDEVNRMIQEIRRWQLRILELGGIDYAKQGIRTPNGDMLNTSMNQYLYFGRARTLPGVRELLEEQREEASRGHGKERLMEMVDMEYYGLEDDKMLEEEERRFEAENHFDAFSDQPDLSGCRIPEPEKIQEGLNVLYSGAASKVVVESEK